MNMKEINIGRTILQKRREKGLTQEDLANYIGVSKASVSNGKPVRVILTLLFRACNTFNISVDEPPVMNRK